MFSLLGFHSFFLYPNGLCYMKSMQHRQAQSFLLFLTLYKLLLCLDRPLGLISFLLLLQKKLAMLITLDLNFALRFHFNKVTEV